MEAVQSCLEGIDRNVPVAVKPAAAKLLMPNTIRTVADVLNLPAWPSEQLRLVVERWQPAAEVTATGRLAGEQDSPSVCCGKFFGAGAERGVPRLLSALSQCLAANRE
jgi:hypothetical protein